MAQSFWHNLPKPIIGLAPMDGVTDAAYRFIMAKYGRPDVIITEFTAAEGIRAGALRLMDDFLYDPIERPVVAQLFGSDPDAFYIASVVASALGFDGIDINMGCPAKNVTQRGAGAALIQDPQRAKAIIRAARRGNADWAAGTTLKEAGVPEALYSVIADFQQKHALTDTRRILPISIKTRIGVKEVIITDWVQHLLETEPAAITIHGRTLAQLYSGSADWEMIGMAAKRIHETDTLALGNGDVQSHDDAVQRARTYGLDGVLIGRASFGNPWVFTATESSYDQKLRVALEHAEYLHAALEGRGFIRIRKHLLDYTRGFPGAKELRTELMRVQSIEDVRAVLVPVVNS